MEPEFRLTNRKPRPRFENTGQGKQQQLFARGGDDLPGQRLLFDPLTTLPGHTTCQTQQQPPSAD